MKYLKIEDSKAAYTIDGVNWKPIDKIDKDALLLLVDLALSGEFEMDAYDEAILNNQAHQIIYKNIFEKFTELLNNKDRFRDESESLYKDAIEKYGQ